MTTSTISLTLPKRSAKLVSAKLFNWVLAIFIILIFVSAVIYLFQIGSLTQKNFLIKEQLNKIKITKAQNLKLENTATSLVSLNKIEQQVQNSGFVGISRVEYIPISYDYLVRNTSH